MGSSLENRRVYIVAYRSTKHLICAIGTLKDHKLRKNAEKDPICARSVQKIFTAEFHINRPKIRG